LVEVHTAQSQAIMGTPWDVPVPRKITSIRLENLCLPLVQAERARNACKQCKKTGAP
jgi:hypothetical protein